MRRGVAPTPHPEREPSAKINERARRELGGLALETLCPRCGHELDLPPPSGESQVSGPDVGEAAEVESPQPLIADSRSTLDSFKRSLRLIGLGALVGDSKIQSTKTYEAGEVLIDGDERTYTVLVRSEQRIHSRSAPAEIRIPLRIAKDHSKNISITTHL